MADIFRETYEQLGGDDVKVTFSSGEQVTVPGEKFLAFCTCATYYKNALKFGERPPIDTLAAVFADEVLESFEPFFRAMAQGMLDNGESLGIPSADIARLRELVEAKS